MNIDLLVTHEADGYHQNKGKDKQKEIYHHDFCKKKKKGIPSLDTCTFI